MVAVLVILVLRVLRWRVTTEGLDNVPRTGGAVVTWNHTGHADFVTCAWDVYRRLGRQPRFLAKGELWEGRVTRLLVRAVDAVPVERGSDAGRARSYAAAVEALRGGDIVAVAPEGTISASFELLPFRPGAVRMARDARVPVVPCVSWGSHRAATSGHAPSWRRAYRLPVSVRFGEPIRVGPTDDVAAVTASLRRRTEELLHRAQAQYPDGAPRGAWWVPHRLGGGAPVPGPIPDTAATEPRTAGEPPFEPSASASERRELHDDRDR